MIRTKNATWTSFERMDLESLHLGPDHYYSYENDGLLDKEFDEDELYHIVYSLPVQEKDKLILINC